MTVTASDATVAAGVIIREQQMAINERGWENLELRLRLDSAGLDASAPDGAMTAARVRALEDAVDASREALRPGASEDRRAEAIRLCDAARKTQ